MTEKQKQRTRAFLELMQELRRLRDAPIFGKLPIAESALELALVVIGGHADAINELEARIQRLEGANGGGT